MSELLVAQCPFCQTRFRLSQEHLQAAAGNVRCGACLKVFNANLTITPAVQQPETENQTSPAISTEPESTDKPQSRRGTLMIHDDLELDDLDLAALGLDESILEEINPAARSTQPFSEEPPAQAHLPVMTQPEPDHTSNNEDTSDLHEDFLATPTARDFELKQPSDESTNPDLHVSPARSGENNGIFLPDRPADAPPAIQAPIAEELPHEPDNMARREPRLGELVELPYLLDEPVVLYEPSRARRSRYRPLWIVLSLLALLGLPAQALFYNFSTLAHDERLRPYLEQLCFLAGCELPARVDIDLIRSSNLMVRAHPEYPNALAIDVILYNRAEFAQPFPVLRMTFNDTRGREVLSKRFRPDEYLGGELAGVTLMPPQTPVHVALDMLDPGPEAAGYELDFLSP